MVRSLCFIAAVAVCSSAAVPSELKAVLDAIQHISGKSLPYLKSDLGKFHESMERDFSRHISQQLQHDSKRFLTNGKDDDDDEKCSTLSIYGKDRGIPADADLSVADCAGGKAAGMCGSDSRSAYYCAATCNIPCNDTKPESDDDIYQGQGGTVTAVGEQGGGEGGGEGGSGNDEGGGSGNTDSFESLCAQESVKKMCTSSGGLADAMNMREMIDEAKQNPDFEDPFICMDGAIKPFICDIMCSDSCKSSDSLGLLSGNDESEGKEGSSGNEDDLSAQLKGFCGDKCMEDFFPGYITFLKEMPKCTEKEEEGKKGKKEEEASEGGSGNDGSSEAQLDTMEAQVAQGLNFACQKNVKGEFCIATMVATEQHEEPDMSKMTCTDPALQSLLNMGCCFGSAVEMTLSQDANMENVMNNETRAEMDEMNYWVAKCGGSILPCGDGALVDAVVLSSSLTVEADGLTMEYLEKPTTIKAIKTGIAAEANANKAARAKDLDKRQIVITKIQIVQARRLEVDVSTRALAASSAEVDYSVVGLSNSNSAATSASLTGMSDSSLASNINNNLPAEDKLTGLSASQSKSVSTQSVKAKSESDGVPDSAIDFILIAVGAVVGVVALVAVGMVFNGRFNSNSGAQEEEAGEEAETSGEVSDKSSKFVV